MSGDLRDTCHRWLSHETAPGGLLHPATDFLDLPGEDQRDAIRSSVTDRYLKTRTPGRFDGRAALLTAGPPGVGKTSVMEIVTPSLEGYRRIDPDVARDLILQAWLDAGFLRSLAAHELVMPDRRPVSPREIGSITQGDAIAVANDVRAHCLARGENFIMEGTLRSTEAVDIARAELDAAGYRSLQIIDVEAPLEVVRAQARDRWWDGRQDGSLINPLGGRFVPDHIIDSLYLPDGATICERNADALYRAATQARMRDVAMTVNRRDELGASTLEQRRSHDGIEVSAAGGAPASRSQQRQQNDDKSDAILPRRDGAEPQPAKARRSRLRFFLDGIRRGGDTAEPGEGPVPGDARRCDASREIVNTVTGERGAQHCLNAAPDGGQHKFPPVQNGPN